MKKISILLSLSMLVFFISSFTNISISTSKSIAVTHYFTDKYHVLNETETLNLDPIVNIPFSGNKFNGFKEALAFKESQGKYQIVNSLGYLGKYQFGKSTLERFKIYDTQLFLKSPNLQERAFIALCSVNKWILIRDIKKNIGKKINGIEITESGILAAAHLGGAGNVKKYLRSGGRQNFKDAYGSSIKHYLVKFSGYDTSIIEANRTPFI